MGAKAVKSSGPNHPKTETPVPGPSVYAVIKSELSVWAIFAPAVILFRLLHLERLGGRELDSKTACPLGLDSSVYEAVSFRFIKATAKPSKRSARANGRMWPLNIPSHNKPRECCHET